MSRLAAPILPLLLVCAAPALGQDLDRGKDLAERLRQFESWIILEEEAAPDPAFLRVDLGFLAFLENRASLEVGRNGIPGSRLDDLEAEQGLDTAGVGAIAELTLGGKVRGGADLLFYSRDGDFAQQDQAVDFDGIRMADPGDFVRTRFGLLSLGGFVEWNAIYGRSYRIGLQGGLRYFRFEIEMDGARGRLAPPTVSQELRAEFLSPFFGGLIELTPFPVLSVFTGVQFIIWSWEQIGLRETRFLNFRTGVTVRVIPGLLGITAEYRFLVVRARTRRSDTGGRQIEGALTANGLGLSLVFSF